MKWPIFIQDRKGRVIYLTQERWEHALAHPGMHDDLLEQIIECVRQGKRKQDVYDPAKFKYIHSFSNLPMGYTDVVVVVKFGWQLEANNFILTAYLVKRW
jgi:hypothetical protein